MDPSLQATSSFLSWPKHFIIERMEGTEFYRQKMKVLKICVIVPTYNNAGTLEQVLGGISEYTNDVVIINDGSTDNTDDIIARFPAFHSVSYETNIGKGWALRKGFEWAIRHGFEYAISIDSDGQHFSEDIPAFIQKLETEGPAIILGARNMKQEGIPGKSSFGHKFSNFWFWIETGVNAPDTQTGFRLYPVRLLKNIKWYTRKFEFEIEVLVRASWKGIKIHSVPVRVFYAPRETRVSHFRPFKDFSRISLLNTVLVIIALSYIIPRNFLKSIFSLSTYKKLRDKIVESSESRLHTAVSLGFGVFMGIIPVWGFQMLIALVLAVVFRLNKLLVILSANISIPPMIPVIVYLSYLTGSLVMGDHAGAQLSFSSSITLETVRQSFMQYVYGSIILAVVSALIVGFSSFILLSNLGKARN